MSNARSGNSPRPTGRPASSKGRDSIVAAAVSAFYEHGYHGTSVRSIALRADVSLSALYHYFASKQDVLTYIVDGFMLGSIEAIGRDVRAAGDDPVARLRAAARTHVHRNATNVALSFITNSEIRSIEGESRVRHVGHRDQIQAYFDSAVLDGRKRKVFHVASPKEASRAIVTMCTAVATWYRETGPLSAEEIADRYGEYALSLVGAVDLHTTLLCRRCG